MSMATAAMVSGEKVCPMCDTLKPAGDFQTTVRRNRPSQRPRLSSYCKSCFALYMRRQREGNIMLQERERRAGFRYRLKHIYGMTEADWYAMLEAQGFGCAICGAQGADRKLSVDHDHKTGEVRGILCHACNHAIGRMEDSPERLEAAAAFLRRHQQRRAES